MFKATELHFHPDRIIFLGILVLGGGFVFTLPFFNSLIYSNGHAVSSHLKDESDLGRVPLEFCLGLKEKAPFLPIPDLQSEMSFSYDPPRPDGDVTSLQLVVRLKKSGESSRVVLPCRLDLEYQREMLRFAKGPSPFWIELKRGEDGLIEGKGLISSLEEEKISAGNFLVNVQESPIQTAQEFTEGSPFRVLAEAKWWGRDLFRDYYDGRADADRLEIGPNEVLELKEGNWLVWKEQRWQVSPNPIDGVPIAHIVSSSGKNLFLEGWGSDGYTRLALNPGSSTSFRQKNETLLGAVRIRSEKQISCILEKDCLVLKKGDWVLKSNGRWKVLRKKEDRESFVKGELFGELFLFEEIAQKQGQKMILGKYFNLNRTQMNPVEVVVQPTRSKKGKS